jgi:hypothetical protein
MALVSAAEAAGAEVDTAEVAVMVAVAATEAAGPRVCPAATRLAAATRPAADPLPWRPVPCPAEAMVEEAEDTEDTEEEEGVAGVMAEGAMAVEAMGVICIFMWGRAHEAIPTVGGRVVTDTGMVTTAPRRARGLRLLRTRARTPAG